MRMFFFLKADGADHEGLVAQDPRCSHSGSYSGCGGEDGRPDQGGVCGGLSSRIPYFENWWLSVTPDIIIPDVEGFR